MERRTPSAQVRLSARESSRCTRQVAELAEHLFGVDKEHVTFCGEHNEMIHITCRSLNHAYVLASRQFERARTSHGGRVYGHFTVFYPMNTRHGNLFTVIPLVEWSGRGGGLSMALYHNSANVNSALDLTGNVGFDLGPSWSISLSDQLVILDDPEDLTQVIAVADDGTQNIFTWNGDNWVAPPGVHDYLRQDTEDPDTWRLWHKGFWYREFHHDDGFVRLKRIVDPVGNELPLDYSLVSPYRLETITGAGGRTFEFIYYPDGQLHYMKHARDLGDPSPGSAILDRYWEVIYDADNRMERIVGPFYSGDPRLHEIVMAYVEGRISGITNKMEQKLEEDPFEIGDVYEYLYDEEGRLEIVIDPTPHVKGNDPLRQHLYVEAYEPGAIYAYYTDRHGHEWQYHYEPAAGLPYPEANLAWFINPLHDAEMYQFDAGRNLRWFRDGYDRHRSFTYDG